MTERSMGLRALPAEYDRHTRTLYLVQNDQDDRDRTTDADELKSAPETLLAPERKTVPPNAATEPPIGYNPAPSEALRKLAGFDGDQFLHAALLAAADAAHEARENRKLEAKKNQDIGTLLEASVKRLDDAAELRSATRTKEIKADFEITNQSIREIASRFESLDRTVRERVLPWMGKVDQRLSAVDERYEELRLELEAMRSQVAGIDQLVARMDRLEHELTALAPGKLSE